MSTPDDDIDVENPHRLQTGHPPRLQRSPSLPNLGAVPHNSPVLQSTRLRHHPRRSSPTAHPLPDSPDTTTPSTPSMPTQKSNQQSDFKIMLKSKTYLITPPLTPSSSLRSESSVAGHSVSAGDGSDTKDELPEGEGVPLSRFLLIGNIPRYISTATLKASFFSSFTSQSTRNNRLTSNPNSNHGEARNDNPIKGMHARFQPTDGVVVLAFHDLRDADRAKTSIETVGITIAAVSDDGQGVSGVVDDRDEADGGQPWERRLTCNFIAPKDLGKLINNTKFISETDGGFFVSSSSSSDQPGNGTVNQKRVLAPESLKNLLGSFGDLCRFQSATRPQGEEPTDDEVFFVEYFDARDAGNAKAALNGRTMFGVKLNLFVGDGSDDSGDGAESEPEVHAYDGGNRHEHIRSYSPSTPTATSCIPFPSSSVDHQPLAEGHVQGENDHTSDREHVFVFERVRPRSVSAGNNGPGTTDPPYGLVSDPSYSPSPSASNPRTSYSSPPMSPAYNVPLSQLARRCSNHLFFDSSGRQTQQEDQERPRSLNVDNPVDIRAFDEQDPEVTPTFVPAVVYPPQHQPHPPYYYSTAPDTAPWPGPYYTSSSPLSQQAPPPALHFPHPPPSPTSFLYHPESHSWTWSQPAPGLGGMLANVTTSGYYLPSVPPPVLAPQNGEMYYPHHQHLPNNGELPGQGRPRETVEYGPPYLPQLDRQLLHSQRNQEFFSSFQPPSPFSTIHIPLTTSPEVSPPELRPVPSMHAASVSGQQAERNQLNIARIEDGQDTRTTVMVKNIPNKMSDKDLIAYIGSVCPRKIDFLYLRMDFKNGCNVGYAFVNFIYVEDLLIFAKSKLDIKWNMFASEKVLQMSYANYQGKEALVEKFKNSCIMDEREAWRPKIFYSEPGPDQGLPEPFPAPTHIRRKERSSINRGTLFIPGSQHLHNVPNREQRFPSGGEQRSLIEPVEMDPPSDGHRSTQHSAPTSPTSCRLTKKPIQHQVSRSTR